MKPNKKMILISVLILAILLFVDKCTPTNISTSDIFRKQALNRAPKFGASISFNSYKIEKIDADLPILYDSINNSFYLRNKNGLTKIDGNGNAIISKPLTTEKQTSTSDFINYLPYVFSLNGIYDYTGNLCQFRAFKNTINTKQDMDDSSFKTTFENLYKTAEMVVYDTDHLQDPSGFYPYYFLISRSLSCNQHLEYQSSKC